MKTMTIANQNAVAAKAVKEEKIMNKNTRYVIAVVIGTICNMKQINKFKEYLTAIKSHNVDILVAGNPIRVQKLGRVINESKSPVRMIGCGVKNNNIFAYTHQDEHPCAWAIDHSDVVITIGEGLVISKAADYAVKSNRSCYIYGKEFKESICRGHYDKEIIMRADIVTTNEAKAIQAAKPVTDPMTAAKAELEAAKKEFEAAKAKLEAAQAKVDALVKPAVEEKKEEEPVGRGAELFVNVEDSADMGTVTAAIQYEYKSINQELEEAINDNSDDILEKGEVFAFGNTSYTVVNSFNMTELEMADSNAEAHKIIEDAVASGNLKVKSVKCDFKFAGKAYNVADKTAFDVSIFNEQDNETKQVIVEESLKAGHIVIAA